MSSKCPRVEDVDSWPVVSPHKGLGAAYRSPPKRNYSRQPSFLAMLNTPQWIQPASSPGSISAVAFPPRFSQLPLLTMRLLYKILMFSGISTVFYHTMHAFPKSSMLSFSFPSSFLRFVFPLCIKPTGSTSSQSSSAMLLTCFPPLTFRSLFRSTMQIKRLPVHRVI